MDVFSDMIPIVLLIVLGYCFRVTNFLTQDVIKKFQNIVVQFTIPCILFRTFVSLELKSDSFIYVVSIFALNTILFFGSKTIGHALKMKHRSIPFYISSFNFAAIGIPLYLALFGGSSMESFSMLGVGNEVFNGLIYCTLAKPFLSNQKADRNPLKNLLNSNTMAVFLGVLVNMTGLSWLFLDNGIGKGIMNTAGYLGGLAIPFGLISIGFGLQFGQKKMRKKSIIFAFARVGAIAVLGLLIQVLVFQNLLMIDFSFVRAYWLFLVLPAPFSAIAFVGKYCDQEEFELVSSSFVVSCMIAVVGYLGFALVG